jgi:hypothetical protein
MVGLLLAALLAEPPANAAPTANAATVDQGTFEVWSGNDLAGREQFTVVETPAGFEIRSESIAQGGNTQFVAMRGLLRTNRQWQPTGGHFDASVGGRLATIDLSGPPGGLKLTTRIKGDRPSTVRARRRVDLVVVQNMLAHLLPLCALAEKSPRQLIAFPDAPITIFPPVIQSFVTRGPDGNVASGKLELAVVSVDFPDLRMALGCKDGKLVTIRQGRYDVSAFRAGYESVGHRFR